MSDGHQFQSVLWKRRLEGLATNSPNAPILELSSNRCISFNTELKEDGQSIMQSDDANHSSEAEMPPWLMNFDIENHPGLENCSCGCTGYSTSGTSLLQLGGSHLPSFEQTPARDALATPPVAQPAWGPSLSFVSLSSGLQPFVEKLYRMLSQPTSFCGCVSWDTAGTSFIVSHNNPRLYTHVLPDAFGHSNLHSFTRQLNIYGFKRCTSMELLQKLDIT